MRVMNRGWIVAGLALMLPCPAAVVVAGPLNPPAGPVTSTQKPLGEVEPRIAVNATNTPGDVTTTLSIVAPGSYYLTGHVSGQAGRVGITINAGSGQVTLDLNGYSLNGVAGSLAGVQVAGITRVVIRNGRVSGWGGHGIAAAGAGSGSVFEDLVVESCGGNGLDLGDGVRAARCSANGNTAIGIRMGGQGSVSGCVANSNATGIEVNGGTRATECVVSGNTVRGILVGSSAAEVERNTVRVSSTGAVGILVSGSGNVIAGNTIGGTSATSSVGLRATGAGNIVRENTVQGVVDAYDFAAGNRLELVLTSLPESIDWPASVRVGGSMTAPAGQSGIVINSSGVTLDLGGHELSGNGSAGSGVTSNGARQNVVVRNGAVRGWGSGGVTLTSCNSPQVTGVRAMGNTGVGIAVNGGGVLDCVSAQNTGAGISCGDNALVSRCTATANGGDNIVAGASSSIQDCTANGSTGGHGINASFLYNTVARCTANSNAQSGIRASQRTRVEGCTAMANAQHGVHATFVGSVERCTIGNNAVCGVLVDAGGGVIIRDNSITENGTGGALGAGVRVSGSGGGNRIEGNSLVLNYRQLDIQVGLNLVVRNTLLGAGAGGTHVIVGGNAFGPFVSVGGVGDITATPNANHPQANLMY